MGILLLLLVVFMIVALVRAVTFKLPEGINVSSLDKYKIGISYTFDRTSMQIQWFIRYGLRYPYRERQVSPVQDLEFHSKVDKAEWPKRFYPDPGKLPEISETRLTLGSNYISWHGAFKSTYKPAHPEFGKLYEQYAANHWVYYRRHEKYTAPKPAPTCIFIHGWTGGQYSMLELVSPLKFLKKLGFNAVFFVHTYHGPRKPVESKFSGEYWLSGDIVRTNEALLQDVHDLRVLIRHIKSIHPDAPLGLWGVSGGGFLVNLTVPFEKVDFAISHVPPASFAGDVLKLPLARSMRMGFRKQNVDRTMLAKLWAPTTPLNYKSLVPKEKLLIVAGLGDALISHSNPLQMAEHWGDPEIAWYPGGHIPLFGYKRIESAVESFLQREVMS